MDIGLQEYVGFLAGFIALACGWSFLWQVLFGEFEGVWGEKENRGNLVVGFVVSSVVAWAILSS